MNFTKSITGLLAGAAIFTASQAGAVIITEDGSHPDDVPALTGFKTLGDMMDGMLVTAKFSNGSQETLVWGDFGIGSGGVKGSDWGLSVDGDTYLDNAWSFVNDTGLLLTNLILDNSDSILATVFDRYFDGAIGTANSARGKDVNVGVSAVYSHPVNLTGDKAVGDLWHMLAIDFTGRDSKGMAGSFSFSQDTDNDTRINDVPAPGTLALLGLGLVAMGIKRRTA